MGVYVDQAIWPYRGQMYCHMIADTHKELEVMAWKIGMNRKWIQKPGKWDEHYDLNPSKRALAVKHGAIEVTGRELGRMLNDRLEEERNGKARTEAKI